MRRNINRLKKDILDILLGKDEIDKLIVWSVKDITERLGYKRTAYGYVSHALNILHAEGKVTVRRKGHTNLWGIREKTVNA